MSAVKKAPCPNGERGSKNRNPVETLSMLNSRSMANSRPRVLVTELEYRKAEALFLSAPGLECLRAPDAEADLASAIREAHASSRDRRGAHLLRSAVRGAAGGRRHRAIRRRTRRHRQGQSHRGRSALHQHAGRPQSVGGRTHDAARRRRGADADRHVNEHGATARGIRRSARSCRERRSRSSAAAASGAASRASPLSVTACRSSAVPGRTCRRPRHWSTFVWS